MRYNGIVMPSFKATPISSPLVGAAPVTPNDSSDLPYVTRGIMVTGTSGNVALVFQDGSQVTLGGLAVGTLYPFAVTRVKATGTTATGIVAFF